jgi:hypothetical protein
MRKIKNNLEKNLFKANNLMDLAKLGVQFSNIIYNFESESKTEFYINLKKNHR